jgi:phage terminase large subunit-like protein
LRHVSELTDAELVAEAERLLDAARPGWRDVARAAQVAPDGDWTVWAFVGGRGAGKSRAGAEWVHEQVAAGRRRIALVGPTAGDVRDVMVEGESGILNCGRVRPNYEPSKRRLTWPNGAIATTYSADEPERLRGPQHDASWCDEIAAWRYPAAWDMLMFGLRLGERPQVMATTTPKPTKLVRDLLGQAVVTRSTTYDNLANLAPTFREQILARYEGTRLGRQELLGELLEDVPGALWSRDLIERSRGTAPDDLSRIVVAIDPAVTSGEQSDATGIVVVGTIQNVGYLLEDLSGRFPPEQWANLAVDAYRRWGADRIVAEANNGGDLVASVLRAVDRNIPVRLVRASRGKRARAEPVSALYEQGRVVHAGTFPELEDELCMWTPDTTESPDRMDALVWGLSDLMLATSKQATAVYSSGRGRL